MEPRSIKVSEVEVELQRALAGLRDMDERGQLPDELRPLLHLAPPDGASVHVSLRHRDSGRPVRPDAAARSWSSRGCGAWIVYEIAPGLGSSGPAPARTGEASGDPLRDFLTALDHVEKDPHLRFVSLKWFRDTYLPKRGYEWASDPDIPRRMVHEAADRELILTAKVPNPKTPEFPVTAIRLNRDHPEVKELLGAKDEGVGPPVAAPEAAPVSPERPDRAAAPLPPG